MGIAVWTSDNCVSGCVTDKEYRNASGIRVECSGQDMGLGRAAVGRPRDPGIVVMLGAPAK
jgi:hypothetical protein